jgi:hypothetical protein
VKSMRGIRLEPIGEDEWMAVLREGLHGGVDRIHFRVGAPPLGAGHGFSQPLGFRQLAVCDLDAIAEILLRLCYVPERAEDDTTDAARPLGLICELPEEALLVPHIGLREGRLHVVVELARPLREAPELDLF